MKNAIREFITYLHNIKQTSNNTEISYERDLNKMAAYLERQGVYNPLKVTETDLNGYLSYLRRNKFAASTISRSVASIRAFYQFLFRAHQIVQDPSENLKPPKVEKKTPEILTVEEVDLLLRQPSLDTAKGLRDKAMLELLYATGMRVSELMHLKVSDVNLNLGYVDCSEGAEMVWKSVPGVQTFRMTNRIRTNAELSVFIQNMMRLTRGKGRRISCFLIAPER